MLHCRITGCNTWHDSLLWQIDISMGCLWPKITKIWRGQKPQILIGWIVHVPSAHWRIQPLGGCFGGGMSCVRVKVAVAFLAMRTCSFHVPPPPTFPHFRKFFPRAFSTKKKKKVQLERRDFRKRRARKEWKRREREIPWKVSLSLSLYLSIGVMPRVPTYSKLMDCFWFIYWDQCKKCQASSSFVQCVLFSMEY